MRYFAGLVIVVASGATVATAQPGPNENTGRVSYTDQHKREATEPACDGSAIELSEPTPAAHGTEFFVIAKQLGDLSKLSIQATRDRVDVMRVRVYYTDGTRKTLSVGKRTAKGKEPIVLELGKPKQIDQIVVTTDRTPAGAYALYGFCGSPGSIATAP